MSVGGGMGAGAVWVDVELRFPDLGKAVRGVGDALKKAGQGAGQAVAASIKAQGNAAAASIRAQGAAAVAAIAASNPAQQAANAFATRMKAQAAATGTVIRANAAAQAQTTRAQGVANAQFAVASSRIRATGAALSMASQGFGAGLRSALQGGASLVGAITSPLRGLFGGGGGSRFGGIVGRLPPLLGAGGLIGAFTGASGGGLLGGAINQAMGMETAMVRLGRVTGLPAGQLKGLTDEIKDMSTVIPVGVEDLFRIATASAKMGIAGRNLGSFTQAVARMTTILGEENMSMDEATNMMARLINVFHLSHTQISGVASAVVGLDVASTASARDILEMTTRMSGLASVMKLTLPQAMALATAMREAGVEVGPGGTAMSQLLVRMAGTRDTGFSKVAGMKLPDFRKLVDTRPMEALERFFAGLQKMSPRESVKALEQLHFTGRLTAGTYEQLARVFDKVGKFGKIADQEFVTGASIQKGFAAVAGTTARQLELLWNNLKLSAIEIGQHLLPIVRGLSGGLGDLFKDIRAYLEDNQDTLRGWGEWIGKKISNVGALWRQFPLFIEYGMTLAGEKFDQFQVIMGRFGKQLWENFKWAFGVPGGALWKILIGFGTGVAAFLGDLFTQVGANLQVQIQNAIRMATNPFAKPLPVPAIKPNAALFAGPLIAGAAAAGAPPGFGGVMANLPDRGAAKRDILADIQDAREQQVQEQQDRRARMDQADAAQLLHEAAVRREQERQRRSLKMRAPRLDLQRAFQGNLDPKAVARDAAIRGAVQDQADALGRMQAEKNRRAIEAGRAFHEQLNQGQDAKHKAAIEAGNLFQKQQDERLQRARDAMGIGGGPGGGANKAADNTEKTIGVLEEMLAQLRKMAGQGVPAEYA